MNNVFRKLCDYQLVNYEGYLPKYKQKIIKLTTEEAHDLNKSLCLQFVPHRYIKVDHDKS